MNLKANRQSLLNALNSVAVGLSSKCPHAYGLYVLLSAQGKSLDIVTDSIAIRAEASVECEIKEEGSCLVSHSKLVALLQRDANDVFLTHADGRLEVEIGGCVTHLPTMPAKDFPASRPEGDQKAFVILDNAAFSNSLSIVCGFAGDGLAHTWNPGLLIQDDSKALVLAACDGKHFARIKLPTSDSNFKVAVPSKLVRSLVSVVGESESLTMSIFDKSVKLDIEGLSLHIQQQEGNYPDEVSKVCERMVKGCDKSITVNRTQLISELQMAGAVLERDEDGVFIEISAATHKLTISAQSKSSASHSYAIDVKAPTDLPKRKINHAFLIGHLRSLDCENVTLYYEPSFKEPGYRVSPEGSNSIAAFLGYFRQ